MGVGDEMKVPFSGKVVHAHPHQNTGSPRPLCGGSEGVHGRPRTEQPGRDAHFGQARADGIQREDVLFVRTTSQEHRAISCNFWLFSGVPHERGADGLREQVLDLDPGPGSLPVFTRCNEQGPHELVPDDEGPLRAQRLQDTVLDCHLVKARCGASQAASVAPGTRHGQHRSTRATTNRTGGLSGDDTRGDDRAFATDDRLVELLQPGHVLGSETSVPTRGAAGRGQPVTLAPHAHRRRGDAETRRDLSDGVQSSRLPGVCCCHRVTVSRTGSDSAARSSQAPRTAVGENSFGKCSAVHIKNLADAASPAQLHPPPEPHHSKGLTPQSGLWTAHTARQGGTCRAEGDQGPPSPASWPRRLERSFGYASSMAELARDCVQADERDVMHLAPAVEGALM